MIAIRQQKNRLETTAMVVMIAGILLLVQPLSIVLYGLGFPVLLAGLVVFIVVSHF
jgi:hypothetical protein